MKKPGYYSSGELMKLAHITKKAIRYYDEHNILKPSYVDPTTRTRFYTDDDLARLQQILLLKTLGFSLSDIKEITINDADSHFMSDSLTLQQKLIEDRIEQLQVVAQTIRETNQRVQEEKTIDWSHMLDLIHNLELETSMKNQYQNASNISARINLHALYSQNKQGWFPWVFEQCNFSHSVSALSGEQDIPTNDKAAQSNRELAVLELGCGDGRFWIENLDRIPGNMQITISDISEGMLRDARRSLSESPQNLLQCFSFEVCDCEALPYPDQSFDFILANHVLFYCNNIEQACTEIRRVLKPGGVFLCSTYGKNHMKEINQFVTDFDKRIILSADKLYDRFGKENGAEILSRHFTSVQWIGYPDSLLVSEPEPLISYILSCHGNQNQYILDRYSEFRNFAKNKVLHGFSVTKEAGVFLCS